MFAFYVVQNIGPTAYIYEWFTCRWAQIFISDGARINVVRATTRFVSIFKFLINFLPDTGGVLSRWFESCYQPAAFFFSPTESVYVNKIFVSFIFHFYFIFKTFIWNIRSHRKTLRYDQIHHMTPCTGAVRTVSVSVNLKRILTRLAVGFRHMFNVIVAYP